MRVTADIIDMQQYAKRSSGSSSHDVLKGMATDYCLAVGFPKDQIFEELPVYSKGKVVTFVDVAAISDDKTLAIEVGTTKPQMLSWLELLFDEVIFMPYGAVLKSDDELTQDNQLLRRENDQLKNQVAEQGRLLYSLKTELAKRTRQWSKEHSD